MKKRGVIKISVLSLSEVRVSSIVHLLKSWVEGEKRSEQRLIPAAQSVCGNLPVDGAAEGCNSCLSVGAVSLQVHSHAFLC